MILPVSRRIIHLYRGEFLDILNLTLRGQLIKGQYIHTFTKMFSEYIGTKHAIPASSGSKAFYAILEAFDFPEGGEVIIPAYDDLSVPKTVEEKGLVSIFCDIDPVTQNIDLKALENTISPKTVAIIVTHLFGNPCHIDSIKKIISGRNIKLIEDCAHAMGTRIGEQHVGTFGQAAFFSFHSTKNFMCLGGGMAVTNDEQLSNRIREIINKLPYPGILDMLRRIMGAYFMHLISSTIFFALFIFPILNVCIFLNVEPVKIYDKKFRGLLNTKKKETRFANVQAFVGIENMKELDRKLEKTKSNAQAFENLLDKKIKKLKTYPGSNYYFFIIFFEEKNKLQKILLKNGIDVGINLMRNCPAYFNSLNKFENVELAIKTSIQIPVYALLSSKKLYVMAEIVNKAYLYIDRHNG